MSPTPGEALDELQRLAGDDELGRYLPGLGDVVAVLRTQIAEALLQKAKDDGDLDPNPPMPRAKTFKPAAPTPPRFASGDVNIQVGQNPGTMSKRQRDAVLRWARKRRGIGT